MATRKINGKEIQTRINDGWKFEVVFKRTHTRNGGHTQGISFTLVCPNNEFIQPSTKFRALKHLTQSQKDNLEVFETLLRLKKRDGLSLGQQIDNRNKIKSLIANEPTPRYQTANECIDNGSYTVL